MSSVSNEWDDFLRQAYEEALSSPDPSTQNGAVLITANGTVIGRGCNDFPEGVDKKYWNTTKEDKYARVVHAEVAAILHAAKMGWVVADSILVCPWAACSNCAKHIAAAGISMLVRHTFSNNGVTTGSHWYADCEIGDEIMRSAGVKIVETVPVETDIMLRRDGKLWSPSASS